MDYHKNRQYSCSYVIYALITGSKYVESGEYKKVIVIGADKMSSIVDYTDRTTCVIFGDGAGAVLLEPTSEEMGIMDHRFYTDGSGWVHLHQKAGGSLKPATHATVDAREHFIYQEGQPVFKFAVTRMADVAAEIMERNKPNLHGGSLVPSGRSGDDARDLCTQKSSRHPALQVGRH